MIIKYEKIQGFISRVIGEDIVYYPRCYIPETAVYHKNGL